MKRSRRDFLSSLVAAMATSQAVPRRGLASVRQDEPAGPSFSIDLESFWARKPFLERLKNLSDAGFKTYEFGRFKTKDVFAISKLSKELDLSAVQFTAYEGIVDPKRRAPFLQAFDDAIEVAELLEVKRLVVVAGETLNGIDRERQVDTLLDALGEAAEKVKETDLTLLLDPIVRKGMPARRIADSVESAAEIVAEVNSPSVKLLVDLENRWVAGADFLKQFKAASGTIGSIRLSERRLAEGATTAGLDPAGLIKLLRETAPSAPLSVELGSKTDPVQSLERLREIAKRAKG